MPFEDLEFFIKINKHHTQYQPFENVRCAYYKEFIGIQYWELKNIYFTAFAKYVQTSIYAAYVYVVNCMFHYHFCYLKERRHIIAIWNS